MHGNLTSGIIPVIIALSVFCGNNARAQNIDGPEARSSWIQTARTSQADQTSQTGRFSILGNPRRYSGYYFDSETGFCCCKARYYSPQTDTFSSRDAFDLPDRYSYCSGNPVSNMDPEGHSCFGCLKRAAGCLKKLFIRKRTVNTEEAPRITAFQIYLIPYITVLDEIIYRDGTIKTVLRRMVKLQMLSKMGFIHDYFYESSGWNSKLRGTWLPFRGIQEEDAVSEERLIKPRGWIIKPGTKPSNWPGAEYPADIPRRVLSRLSSPIEAAISRSFGGGIWNEGLYDRLLDGNPAWNHIRFRLVDTGKIFKLKTDMEDINEALDNLTPPVIEIP